jgi:hypothetical protein
MNFSKSDFPHIKSSAIIFLCALAGSGAALTYSQSYVARAQHSQQDARHQLNEAQHQLADARNRMTAAQDGQKIKETYALKFAELQDRMIIGNEQRLDWIEGLDKIRKQNRMPEFTYTIGPQRPYAPAPGLESGNFDLNLSPITLHLALLHEAQLINFFDTLRSELKGAFILDHCALTRSGAEFENSSAPQLTAECAGGWLTLKNRNEK